ncbi:MAG: 7-carboxy-7-deazaguanine synthase QueE [Cytophagaceae bacterium]
MKSTKNSESLILSLQDGTSLPLMEDFYTIQGEGYHQGKAAYFIRLGGCDVGCVWCDVKESWDESKHPLTSVEDIAQRASAFPSKTIVVTGGEPLSHNLDPLCKALKKAGLVRNIETSGVYPMSGEWEWICFSPKKFKEPLPTIFPVADELKVIIYHKSDLAWAEKFVSEMKPGCKFYLQPEWSVHEEILPLLIEYVKQNPHWEVSLQIHKYMNIP